MYGSSVITIKLLSLSITIGGLELSFIKISLMCYYEEYTFHPNRGGHMVIIF